MNDIPPRQKVMDFATGDRNGKFYSHDHPCLNFEDAYPCPVCRLGQIRNLPLMDAFACDLCNHIFEANLERQQISMVSRQPALIWRWNGSQWVEAQLEGMELSWGYTLAAIALVAIPTALMGLAIYAFPPTPGTPLFWIPYVWAGLVFLSHLGIIVWLVIEFYQFPVGVYLRAIRQRLPSRLRRY